MQKIISYDNDFDKCGPDESLAFNKYLGDLSDDGTKQCNGAEWIDVPSAVVVGGNVIVSLQGDIDGTGTIEIDDAILLAQSILGIVDMEFTLEQADVTQDGVKNLDDAIKIARIALGIEE